jgi:hypothetical protein
VSLRRHEGYLLIDNRESPGVPVELAAGAGALCVGKSTLYESATYTCSHCQRIVVMNPTRDRERGFCRKCNHVICDGCTTALQQTMQCIPFAKILDDAQEAAIKASSIIIPGA